MKMNRTALWDSLGGYWKWGPRFVLEFRWRCNWSCLANNTISISCPMTSGPWSFSPTRCVGYNKIKVCGKEFIGWPNSKTQSIRCGRIQTIMTWRISSQKHQLGCQNLLEKFDEAMNGGIQILTLGALDNNFLVNDMGVQVYRNFNFGIHGKGVFIKFDARNSSLGRFSTPKKG